MICTKVSQVYDVPMPSQVQHFLEPLQVAISVGLEGTVISMTCIGLDSFLHRLVFWMFIPPLISALICLISIVRLIWRRKLSRDAFVQSALPPVIRMLFLLYPAVTSKAVESY